MVRTPAGAAPVPALAEDAAAHPHPDRGVRRGPQRRGPGARHRVQRGRPGTATVVDIFALTCPRLNQSSAGLTWPRSTARRASGSISTRWMDRPGFMTSGIGMLRRAVARRSRLSSPASARWPSAAPFPAYAALLQKLAREGRFDTPHFNIVTDSISINSVWWRPGCDGWFVPNEDSAEVMRAAGVDPARLHVTGFPVTPYFRKNEGHRHPARPRRRRRRRACSTSSIPGRRTPRRPRACSSARRIGRSPAPSGATSRCGKTLDGRPRRSGAAGRRSSAGQTRYPTSS